MVHWIHEDIHVPEHCVRATLGSGVISDLYRYA